MHTNAESIQQDHRQQAPMARILRIGWCVVRVRVDGDQKGTSIVLIFNHAYFMTTVVTAEIRRQYYTQPRPHDLTVWLL